MEHDDLAVLTDTEVLGRDGASLGRVEDVYLDRSSDRPAWVMVPGEPRAKAVPLADATFDGEGRLVVPYDAATVAAAPDAEAGAGRIREEQEADLAEHYGVDYPSRAGEPVLPGVPTASPEEREERPGGAEI